MKIKAALIDLDDTLTETKPLYKSALKVCREVFNQSTKLDYSYKKFHDLYMKARAETKALVPSSAAKHNRAIYFQRLLENLEIDTDFDLVFQLYETYYDHVYHNMKLYPNAERLLKWFKKKKKTIVIVSDGNTHVRLRKIHALGISKYIDYLVSSEEVGIDKPGSQAFLLGLQKAKVKKEESIFIGNKASTDILGAELLDFVSIQINLLNHPDDKPKEKNEKPDYMVKDLSKVIEIIKKLES